MPIKKDKAWDTAMMGYGNELKSIVSQYENPDILELGAGRWASFPLDEMPASIGSYTVNDISAEELALLPDEYKKARFDVSGDASNFRENYDVVFSRFLAEHVSDGLAMHKNVYSVLRNGGTAFHLIPTLYALPFFVNKFIPESMGNILLKLFTGERRAGLKFPAPYSICYSNPHKMARILKEIGYKDVKVRNFYGHFYYEKIPIINSIHTKLSTFVSDRDWHQFGTYAYITAVK